MAPSLSLIFDRHSEWVPVLGGLTLDWVQTDVLMEFASFIALVLDFYFCNMFNRNIGAIITKVLQVIVSPLSFVVPLWPGLRFAQATHCLTSCSFGVTT